MSTVPVPEKQQDLISTKDTISSLHEDLLLDIFDHVVEKITLGTSKVYNQSSGIPDLAVEFDKEMMILSHVCHHWHSLIYITRPLVNITIINPVSDTLSKFQSLPTVQNPIYLFNLHVEEGRENQFTEDILDEVFKDVDTPSEDVDEASKSRRGLRGFSFKSSRVEPITKLVNLNFEQVRYLTFVGLDVPWPQSKVDPFWSTVYGSTALKRVGYHSYKPTFDLSEPSETLSELANKKSVAKPSDLESQIPLSRLTSIQITEMTMNDVLSLLSKASALNQFRVGNITGKPSVRWREKRIVVKDLTSLAIDGTEDGNLLLFDTLVTPALLHLELRQSEGQGYTNTITFLQRNGSQLKGLLLKLEGSDKNALVALATSIRTLLNNLLEFSVEFSNGYNSEAISRFIFMLWPAVDPQKRKILPKLSKVRFFGHLLGFLSCREFAQFRRSSGVPLSEVIVALDAPFAQQEADYCEARWNKIRHYVDRLVFEEVMADGTRYVLSSWSNPPA